MPGLLTHAPVTDEQRRENDRHRPLVVAAVLGLLTLYVYLFTHAADVVGMPRPEDLAESLGIAIEHVFDRDRNVDSTVRITQTQRIRSNDDERLALYLILAAGFLCAYFLPLRYKQPSLALWTVEALLVLYGLEATAGLLFAHLVVYLVLHPDGSHNRWLSVLAGVAAYFAFVHGPRGEPWEAALLGGLPLLSLFLYRHLVLRLLKVPRFAPVLRTITIQSAILTVCISALVEGLSGDEWSLPLGLLLFFWQWERLIMYHVDYKDGLVPHDLSFPRYIAVFLHPGTMPNWTWGVTIGQGYAYANNVFLCEDKNKIVLSGVKIWAVALVYIVFADWLISGLREWFEAVGIPVHDAYTRRMVRHFVAGDDIGTLSVLLTTLLDLCRWTMLWAGIVHFKVGIWRICGYGVDPYIHRPWASTNLVTLWSRFTFHYRAFLISAFYYPVFFRFFKKYRYLRVFTATMAAACVGNLIWGHVTERLFYRGMELEHMLYALGTWPYFLLLGLGISCTQLYLMWRKRVRKPWTLDRWLITDVLATYCTLQFFALIHIFARPVTDSTVWDLWRLFLKAFGIHLTA